MFNNFIYFIIVLLIYTTYQPAKTTNFTAANTAFLFLISVFLFTWFTKFCFKRLENQIFKFNIYDSDRDISEKFDKLIKQQTILAIILFSFDLYFLNLPDFFSGFYILKMIPAVNAFLFILLFLSYLIIIWNLSNNVFQVLNGSSISLRSYIISNLSFAVPIFLPWICLSVIYDLIFALPFNLFHNFLLTTHGQIIFFMLFLFSAIITGPKIIQKLWNCKPLEIGEKRYIIENICKKADVKYNDIVYWPIFNGTMITAGVMGVVKKFRYILVTRALLDNLDSSELEAVIVHEAGHVKKKHLLFYVFFITGYMLVSFILSDFIFFLLYSNPVYFITDILGITLVSAAPTLYITITILSFIIYFRYIFAYFMRNFERQADLYVFEILNSAKSLISAFYKIIQISGQSPEKPNWHHFSIKERITHLIRCESNRKLISLHNKKIRNITAAYIISIFIIGTAGLYLNFSDLKTSASFKITENTLQKELQKNPENPEIYKLLGDIYYFKKDFDKTIKMYLASLNLKPDNFEVLNNLAWLMSTCEDKKFIDPEKALYFAKLAVKEKKAPHILDTLAECFYINNMFYEAFKAETLAIELAPKNLMYYKKRLKKFERSYKMNIPEKYL